jgi:uncharacterized protein YkwD
MNRIVTSIAAASFLLLSACGGSGGGGNTTVATTTTTTLPVSTIVASVPAGTYGAGSDKQYAFDYLNTQRTVCGFGTIRQQLQLDQAAQSHANYFVTNNIGITHYENQALYPSGYTGDYVNQREVAAGYNYASAGEVITTTVLTYAPSYGEDAIMEFFAAPYHGYDQLLGFRDLGIGINTRNDVVIDFGSTTMNSEQSLGWSDVVTYPCAGTTGVLSQTYADEVPAPISGRNLQFSPIGTPIYIKVRDSNTLTLNSYDLRIQGGSTPVTLIPLSMSNDQNGVFRDHSVMILMPNAPLAKNTTYVFTATGINTYTWNNISPVNISFTFTTGSH